MNHINNLEAEQTMIGSIINDNDLLLEHSTLSIDHFTIPEHKILMHSILEMFDKSLDININTITSYTTEKGTYDNTGGVEYMLEMVTSIVTTSNSQYYYDILDSNKKKRELLNISKALENKLNKKDVNVNDLLELAYKALDDISFNNTPTIKSITELNKESYELFRKRMNGELKCDGLLSGFKNLDNLIGGFKNSSVIIIAARPSVGKTALALNLATKTVKSNQDTTICVFSLEMSANELYERILSSESKVSGHKYKYGKLSEYEIGKDFEARKKIIELQIFVEDRALIKVSEMSKICKKLKKEKGTLNLVIIDYLQLIEPSENNSSKQVQIAQISRELKQLAKELNVCVIALSQLSREVEKRPEQKPRLSDLRDSGAIEADADIVALMYRPDYQTKEIEDISEVELIIAKNRSGKTGTIDFMFDKSVSEFYEK